MEADISRILHPASRIEKLIPGDEFIVKCIQMDQEQYNQLGKFDGFDAPSRKVRSPKGGAATKSRK
jgi:hypothetical protein